MRHSAHVAHGRVEGVTPEVSFTTLREVMLASVVSC